MKINHFPSMAKWQIVSVTTFLVKVIRSISPSAAAGISPRAWALNTVLDQQRGPLRTHQPAQGPSSWGHRQFFKSHLLLHGSSILPQRTSLPQSTQVFLLPPGELFWHSEPYYLLAFGGLWVRSHHHCFASPFTLFAHIRLSCACSITGPAWSPDTCVY